MQELILSDGTKIYEISQEERSKIPPCPEQIQSGRNKLKRNYADPVFDPLAYGETLISRMPNGEKFTVNAHGRWDSFRSQMPSSFRLMVREVYCATDEERRRLWNNSNSQQRNSESNRLNIDIATGANDGDKIKAMAARNGFEIGRAGQAGRVAPKWAKKIYDSGIGDEIYRTIAGIDRGNIAVVIPTLIEWLSKAGTQEQVHQRANLLIAKLEIPTGSSGQITTQTNQRISSLVRTGQKNW